MYEIYLQYENPSFIDTLCRWTRINTFLGIVLPTFDIYSDFLFLIGTWQLLHAPAPSTLFTSEEEAGRIF